MLRELFHIPILDIPVFGYGLMLVIAFFAVLQLSQFLARRGRIKPELFVNAAFLALFSGVVGARVSHVLENLPQYTRPDLSAWQNFRGMIDLSNGGLTFYGGFLLATPVCIAYAIRKKVSVLVGMDIIAICLMVGLGFGRIGCFLNGCCYGAPCDLPWAVRFPYMSDAYASQFADGRIEPPRRLTEQEQGKALLPVQVVLRDPHLQSLAARERALPVHPAQLYSAFNAFLLAGLLFSYFTLSPAPGRVFAVMLVLEGGTRFLLEMLRVEPPVKPEWFGPMSLAMLTGALLVPAGVALWFFCKWRIRPPRPLLQPASPL